MRKTLSYGGMLEVSRASFDKIPDHRQSSKVDIPLSDVLMSALGIFALKYPSLLKFDKEVRKAPDSAESHNFKTLFGVSKPPDDTNMRQTIDDVESTNLRAPFKSIFHELQRGKALDPFVFYRGSYLMAIDGTGFFSSKQVHCNNCCVKNHRDGTKTYHHQMLGVALIHPDLKQVIPFAPEAIQKQDGEKKNDCERNAVKRLLAAIRQDYPKLNITITEDALSANYPHIKELINHKMHFILGIKPGDHKNFFERLEEAELAGMVTKLVIERDGFKWEYRYINDFILNENKPDLLVNYFECVETDKKGNVKIFSWVTDFKICDNNIEKLMRGGRARWRIENEVFNTLKNQGYQFEHNFGHGKNNLSTNFAMLMMLAFLIDQVSELCCKVYQLAREKTHQKYSLWEKMRTVFSTFAVNSWEIFFGIINKTIKIRYTFDTG